MTPIVCVGEDRAIREAGDAEAHVRRQVLAALGEFDAAALMRCVIAYEPIWAIGTGLAAEPNDAETMASAIRDTLAALQPATAEAVRLLYGGSVTDANADAILSQPSVDGALVGGASLNATAFHAIVAAAAD